MKTKHLNALQKYGSVRKAASHLGLPRSTFFDNLNREREFLRRSQTCESPRADSTRRGKVRRYIFTCAVKGADVHVDFINNLKAYAQHIKAELIVGPLAARGGRNRYAAPTEVDDFPPEITELISDEPLVVGNVRFCPELNLTPTMVRPLQGLQTYSKHRWGIFPHTKISLETVPTHKHKPAKFIATTGCCTKPMYSETKAGKKAYFDHMFGAVIVEVSSEGTWFRHLIPNNEMDGSFYDLDVLVDAGKISKHDGVAAIVYGDVHFEKIDAAVARASWGWCLEDSKPKETLTSKLNPFSQVYHDLMDMTAANYHELDDPLKRYELWVRGRKNVALDFYACFQFLKHVSTLSEENVIVDSNHEYFIDKWLKKFDPLIKEDFVNAETFYKLKLAKMSSIKTRDEKSFLHMLMEAQADTAYDKELLKQFRFLRPDESLELFNIELGWHGHRGPNGRRGSRTAFRYVTEKSTIAHLHSPYIESGCHVVGTSSQLDLGYNEGPSSWAPTHEIIYPNGTRTLITMSDNKFWADQKL